MKTTHEFHVNGMHCTACTVLIEETFTDLPHVEHAIASLAKRRVQVTGDFEGSPEEVAAELSALIESHGYTLSTTPPALQAAWGDFAYAFPIALVLAGAFVLLQRAGLASLVPGGTLSLGTALFIGLIASVSSCLAVVGGLVLSLATSAAKAGGARRSLVLFHIGRLGGFFLLGGLVGLVGSAFHLSLTASAILGVVVALVMLILGLNLLDVFSITRRFELALPAGLSRRVRASSGQGGVLASVAIGAGTFFLPCGFTQSMQLYALSTGSFTTGALTMFTFAMGTLPMLALLSFGSWSIANKPWKGIFFKTAGLIVIALAVVNAAGALATLGVIPPLFTF